MEQWEIDLRARLNKDIPDGAYQIGSGKWVAWTGKLGYITYLVEIERTLRDNQKSIKDAENDYLNYHILNADKIKEIFKDLFKDDKR